MSARVIVVGSRKGGVNKTTTTVNLGYELSLLGKRVLILDFDSQGDCTKFLEGKEESPFYIGDALMDRKFDIKKAIYPAIIKNEKQKNLHYIAGRRGDTMSKLDMDMFSLPRREERLKMHIENVIDDYDFILIDTPPSTSVLGLNAVMAATEFLFVTEFKKNAFDGIDTLIEHIESVTFKEEDDLKFTVVPTCIDKREKKALDFGIAYMAARFPTKTAKTTIQRRTLFLEAEQHLEPASAYSPKHKASQLYRDLALEVIAC